MSDELEIAKLKAKIATLESQISNLKSACLINFNVALVAATGAMQSGKGEKGTTVEKISELMKLLHKELGVEDTSDHTSDE